MTGRWARYRALESRERRLFHEAARTLFAARLRLAAGSFRAALSWSRRARTARGPSADPEDVARAVRRAARAVPGSKCLPQALAGAVLLRRRGLDPELKLGAAARPEGGLVAHAWLELEGRVVLGEVEPGRFRPFAPLPDAPPPGSRKSE